MFGTKRTAQQVLRNQDELSKEHSRIVHDNPLNGLWPWVIRKKRTELASATNDAISVLKREQKEGRFKNVPGGQAETPTLDDLAKGEAADKKLRERGGGIEGF